MGGSMEGEGGQEESGGRRGEGVEMWKDGGGRRKVEEGGKGEGGGERE